MGKSHKNYKNFLILMNYFQYSPVYTSHTFSDHKIFHERTPRRESQSVELGYSAGFTNCELTCIKHPPGIPANDKYFIKENQRHKPKQLISSGIRTMPCPCGNIDNTLGYLHNYTLVQIDTDTNLETLKPKEQATQRAFLFSSFSLSNKPKPKNYSYLEQVSIFLHTPN